MKFNRTMIYVAAGVTVAAAVPVGILSADASTSAVASTAACGPACFSPFVESLGSGEVLAVSGSGAGASVVMATASSTSTAQDWTAQVLPQTVTSAAGLGIISSRLETDYSSDQPEEFQYVPGGKPSGLCLADGYGTQNIDGGLSNYYYPSTSVTIEPCGLTAGTIWVPDNNGQGSGVPAILINAGYEGAYYYGYLQNIASQPTEGYATPFDVPDVLTVNSNNNVVLAQLSELGGNVSESQEWSGLSPQVNAALQQSAVRAKAAAAKLAG
jgi:hypothetical protein